MIKAALSRATELLLVAFGVSVLTFLMIHLVPGDAAQVMLGASDVAPERVAALRHQLGLDQSLIGQYLHWIGGALHGDFGRSVWTGEPVIGEIAGRVGVTVELSVLGLILAILLAVPAGCLMATMRTSAADYAVRVLSIIGVTIPSFWLGAMLLFGAGVLTPACRWSAGCHSPPTRSAICNACCSPPSRWPCRCSPRWPAWSARRCWRRWARTMSAPPAPRASPNGASCSPTPYATR
jgi:ABC-type dipeptide/oligopeptide/nickel transport system permease component